MAGLLDAFGDDNTRFSLGLLAAAGPRFDGANDGQRIQEALMGMDAYKQKQAQSKMQQMQMEAYQAQAEQAKQEREQRARISAGMGQFFKQGQPALAPLMGDASSGILPSNGRAAVAPSFDANGAALFLAQNGAYEDALKYLPKPKEAPINKLDAKDYTPASVQKFAQSGDYADLVRMDKAQFQNTGGFTMALDPFTGKPLNQIHNTQSPDSKASNAVSWANHSLSSERLNFDRAGGTEGGGGTSQMGLNKLFGKPQAGYRWKADGSLEFIPGGPADQKAQAQKGGEGTVGGVVADLRDKYTQLNTENGIVSTQNRLGTNLGAAFGSSDFGQKLNGIVGTKTQSARDSIAMTRPLLLQSIMKATGMSAKQMDSNAELKLYLATATDPQKGLEANLEALDRIEALYGGGNEKFNAGTPQASTNNGWSMQKVK
jgi:hypothetical protein